METADFPLWRFGALAGSLIPGLLIVVILLRVGQRRLSPRLLATAIIGGVGIAFLPLTLSTLEPAVQAHLDGLSFFLVRAFGFAGLSEEGAKLLAAWFMVRPNVLRRGRADFILGCAGVGLGFALIENVSYVLQASDAWKSVALIRSVSAVPMHAFLGLALGYGLSRAESATGWGRLAAVLGVWLFCAALHGLYDLPMFLGEMLPLTLPPVEALSTALSVTTPTLLAATHVSAVAATAVAGLFAIAACRREASEDAPAPKLSPPLLDALVFAPATGILVSGALLATAIAALGVAIVADISGAIRSFPLFVAGFGMFIGALGLGMGAPDLATVPRAIRGWRSALAVFAARRPIATGLSGAAACAALAALGWWSASGLRYAVASILVMSGGALNGVGATDRALANFDAALGYAPDFLYAFQARADVYRVRQDYDRALADLDRAVTLHPDDARAHASRALIYITKHDYGRALAAFDLALTIDANDAAIHVARGGARLEARDPTGARDDAEQALRLKPDFSGAHELHARILTEQDDVAGAIGAYDKAISADPKNAEAYFARGRLHFERQDFREAAEDFWRASATGANRSYAMLWLFLARSRTGQDGALELTKWSEATSREAWPFPIAELYLGVRPLASVASAAATTDQQCELAFYFGELQITSGQQQEAARYLARAGELCPHDFVETRMARKELARLRAAGKAGDKAEPEARQMRTAPASAPAAPRALPSASSRAKHRK